jgi:hypothetical protein
VLHRYTRVRRFGGRSERQGRLLLEGWMEMSIDGGSLLNYGFWVEVFILVIPQALSNRACALIDRKQMMLRVVVMIRPY